MSAYDILRSFAETREADHVPIRDGITYAQARDAASEIERLQAEVTRLTAEQDAISVAIGTNEYMDPPDGGNVSLAEQVRRMRDALLARVEAAERDLMDSAMLLRRVSRLLAKADPSALAPRNAMDWLTRRPWFKASPLRDDAAMEGGK